MLAPPPPRPLTGTFTGPTGVTTPAYAPKPPPITPPNTTGLPTGTDPMGGYNMLHARAPGSWTSGMNYNGAPITQAQADQLNQVSQEAVNPMYNSWGGVNQALKYQGTQGAYTSAPPPTGGASPTDILNKANSAATPKIMPQLSSALGGQYTGYGNSTIKPNSDTTPHGIQVGSTGSDLSQTGNANYNMQTTPTNPLAPPVPPINGGFTGVFPRQTTQPGLVPFLPPTVQPKPLAPPLTNPTPLVPPPVIPNLNNVIRNSGFRPIASVYHSRV